MKNLLMVATLIVSLSPTAFAKENTSSEAQAVDSACSQEASTAGCGADKVGTGLLKCLHAYKKSHHDFKFSDSCKSAMKSLRKEKSQK